MKKIIGMLLISFLGFLGRPTGVVGNSIVAEATIHANSMFDCGGTQEAAYCFQVDQNISGIITQEDEIENINHNKPV